MTAWTSGEAYEAFMGRWSRRVAGPFLDGLGVTPGLRWVDVGCGTGALSTAVLDRCAPASVLGVDPSAAHVAWAAEHEPRARFVQGDAGSLAPGSADVVVSGLVLNFIPDAPSALASMRDAAPGGVVAAYVWDYAGGMGLLRAFWDAAVSLDPAAAVHDEGRREGSLCSPDALGALWSGAGLRDVQTRAVEVPTPFRDLDDLWAPFLAGRAPAPAYAMSLPPERRDELRAAFSARVPVAEDGSVPLTARAWAVQGRC